MNIQELQANIIKKYRGDPFSDPKTWQLLEKKLPSQHWELFLENDSAPQFLELLPQIFPIKTFSADEDAQLCWERIGNFYKNLQLHHQAISIYQSLYDQLLFTQSESKKRLRKGTPFVWMSDCYTALDCPVLSKRCLMLALCENAVNEKGRVPSKTTGTYWRLAHRHGLSDSAIKSYGQQVYNTWKKNPESAFYPEWLLQQLDKVWMTEVPTPIEAGMYLSNGIYIKSLLKKLGDPQGKTLESIADYILSCMPGCRTALRKRSRSSEYDLVCTFEGIVSDFRTELGRYFVCECKDWKKAVDFSATAKFCRVLDSVRSKFGILFSPKGISGEKKLKYAENERRKIFHERNIVLVVIDYEDMNSVAGGDNFIQLLRNKYEQIRLDFVS